jgi:hypothetical protein
MFESFDTHRLSAARCPAFSDTVRDWLPQVLEQFSIPLNKFGTGCHKTLDDLADEIMRGESRLDVDPSSGRLVRVGSVVRLDVRYLPADAAPLKLYEAKQRFTDGRTRYRPTEFAVWEKLKAGEDPDSGALRALNEELSLKGSLHTQPWAISEVLRDADDYPAIRSRFKTFDFQVYLSPEQFCPDGYQEIQRDKTTTFLWKPLVSCCARNAMASVNETTVRLRPPFRPEQSG